MRALGRLGPGAKPPTPSRGLVLTDRGFSMGAAPRMAIFPGVASLRLVLALNRFGGALRDELDRRRRCKA